MIDLRLTFRVFVILTLKEGVTGHSGNREREVGGNQEDAKNVGKSRAVAKRKTPWIFPVFTPFFVFGLNFENWGKNWGNFWERTYDKAKGHYEMRKLHYKGRCTKKTLSKCKDICRTYDKIQTAFADWLQENEEIVSFQCNVKIEIGAKDPYTTDFYAEKKDGTVLVRECVWRKNLSRPTTCRLLDLSRNYWLSQGVEDWGIVIEKEDKDESK